MMGDNTGSVNVYINQWRSSSAVYRVALGLAVTVFLLIVFGWLVIEIYNIRRKKQMKIKSMRDKMDGVESMQRSIEKTNNNKRERKKGLNEDENSAIMREVLIKNVTNFTVNASDFYDKLSDIDEEDESFIHISHTM